MQSTLNHSLKAVTLMLCVAVVAIVGLITHDGLVLEAIAAVSIAGVSGMMFEMVVDRLRALRP